MVTNNLTYCGPTNSNTALRVGVVSDASWRNSKESTTSGLEGAVQSEFQEETEATWIRHHIQERNAYFHPSLCADGTSVRNLQPVRRTEGVFSIQLQVAR